MTGVVPSERNIKKARQDVGLFFIRFEFVLPKTQ
jgi:hypothetical protein